MHTKTDINNMTLNEIRSRKKELISQYEQIGIPSESEVKNSSNMVYVHGYTRSDGTEVRSHWRSKPISAGATYEPKGKILTGGIRYDDVPNSSVEERVYDKSNIIPIITNGIKNIKTGSKSLKKQVSKNLTDKNMINNIVSGISKKSQVSVDNLIKLLKEKSGNLFKSLNKQQNLIKDTNMKAGNNNVSKNKENISISDVSQHISSNVQKSIDKYDKSLIETNNNESNEKNLDFVKLLKLSSELALDTVMPHKSKHIQQPFTQQFHLENARGYIKPSQITRKMTNIDNVAVYSNSILNKKMERLLIRRKQTDK